jgi:preprotein translocase subunit SecD
MDPLLKSADTTRRDTALLSSAATRGDSAARRDSAGRPTTAGVFARAVQPGSHTGQYIVTEADYRRLQPLLDSAEFQAALPPGKVLRWGADSIVSGGQIFRPLYVLDSRPIITGEYLTDARRPRIRPRATWCSSS